MTTPDLTPTDQDRSRDLRADLALCDAATPGPYTTRQGYSPRAGNDEPYNLYILCPSNLSGLTHCVVAVLTGPTDQQQIQDAYFFRDARTGWPAAIRRALAAEAEVATLRARVAKLEDTPHAAS